MNKRKFSLGEIVSKLNQENAGQPQLPVAENTPSQPVKELPPAQATPSINKELDREQPDPTTKAPDGVPDQPVFDQPHARKWLQHRSVENKSITESEKKS